MMCRISDVRVVAVANGFAGLFTVDREGDELSLVDETQSDLRGRVYRCANCQRVWSGEKLDSFDVVRSHFGTSPWWNIRENQIKELSDPSLRPTIKQQLGVFAV